MDALQSLIKKFWAGTATEEERKQLLHLLNAGEGELKEKMRLLFEVEVAPKKEPILVRLTSGPVRWIAAAVILVALALPALLRPTNPRAHNLTAEARALPRMDTVLDRDSGTLALTTSDGSLITLYPGSRIVYLDSFDTDKREVMLEGKALFTVARDLHRPFKVLAAGLNTTVLGTTFLVNSSRSGDACVQLFEGRVKVQSNSRNSTAQEVVLQPGEQVMVHPGSADVVVSRIPGASPALAKTPSSRIEPKRIDRFQFDQQQLADIFSQLSRHYHTRIVYDPGDIKGKVFTGAFATDKPVGSIVRLIAALNDLNVTAQGDSLIITK